MIAKGPAEELGLTVNTQPVMLTAGIACYRAWRAEGGAEPAVVAGHSLGEYTALVAAGSLALADALPLVRFRALRAQQHHTPLEVQLVQDELRDNLQNFIQIERGVKFFPDFVELTVQVNLLIKLALHIIELALGLDQPLDLDNELLVFGAQLHQAG